VSVAAPPTRRRPAAVHWLRSRIPLVAALVLSGAIVLSAFSSVRRWEREHVRQTFERAAQGLLDDALEAVGDDTASLLAIRAFARASHEVEPDEFREFTQPWLARAAGARRLGIALLRGEELRVVRVEPAASEGAGPGAPTGQLARTLRGASTGGPIVVAGPEALGFAGGDPNAVLCVLAIDPPARAGDRGARRFAFSVLDLAGLLRQTERGAALGPALRLRVLDARAPDASGPDRLSLRASFAIGERQWSVVADSERGAWGHDLRWLPWAVLAVGLLLMALLTGYLRIIVRRYHAVEQIAGERKDWITGIMDNVGEGILTIDAEGNVGSFNRAAERLFGWSAAEALGQPLAHFFEPGEAASGAAAGAHAAADWQRIVGRGARERTARRRDGSTFPADVAVSQMFLGERRLLIGSVRDVSDRKESERQLAHARKVEAVGQLTGGVAHDFNNVLTVLLGNLQLLERLSSADPRSIGPIQTAIRAAERGAELTHRLLAFSRQQPLRREAVDVNAQVLGAVRLVRRTLPGTIAIETVPAPALWRAVADAGQLENVLINLAVNARDAMPNGGRLIFETQNVQLDRANSDHRLEVEPGAYVMIAVSDTGMGMPEVVRERAFDPFFTTKEPGKGTGLGLSMVYGFVKQLGGHIQIYSEEGIGTTIRVYLPRADASAAPAQSPPPPQSTAGRGEVVLVVEDSAEVRELVAGMLGDLGYQVRPAAGAAQALELVELGAEPDLVLTDVVMPGGITGVDLVRQLRERSLDVPVVYCSGYSEHAVFREGQLGPRERFVQKPFGHGVLARVVRELLDSEAKP
jgi:PAS domain S-box-containing protein